jgi:CubicO group peptidase (beta-lactamase class C family)
MSLSLATPAAAAAPLSRQDVVAALPKLETVARDALQRTGVPGMAIGVVHGDEVIYLGGFGVRELGKAAAVDPDTVFQLASVSKPLAATVVAALVGDGVVGWDDPVVKDDPLFQLYDPSATRQVTLRDLFAHRSGLPAFAGDRLEDMGYDRAAVLFRLRYLPPASGFRSSYAYTNFGLTEAAVAAASAAGRTWEDVAEDRLYRPLGMAHTSSRYADFQSREDRATAHMLLNGAWIVSPERRDPDAQSPAGGASSNVRDMVQWLRLQLGGGTVDGREIVARAALDETHRPQVIRSPPADPATDHASFYGLGWNVDYDQNGRVRLGHSGGFNLGAGTFVGLLPAERLGIVVLTNGSPIGVAEAVGRSFFDLALDGTVQRDWLALFRDVFATAMKADYGALDKAGPPASPVPALPDDAYAGRYRNDFFGTIEVAATGQGLVIEEGPQLTPFPLRHVDRDVFAYQPKGENAYGPSAVTFLAGPGGKAAAVRIENLDMDGQGTFARTGN